MGLLLRHPSIEKGFEEIGKATDHLFSIDLHPILSEESIEPIRQILEFLLHVPMAVRHRDFASEAQCLSFQTHNIFP